MLTFNVADDLVGHVVTAGGGPNVDENDTQAAVRRDTRGVALNLRDDLLVEIVAPLLQRAELFGCCAGGAYVGSMQRGELPVQIVLGRIVIGNRLGGVGRKRAGIDVYKRQV